jgi:hypothetical protein
MSLHPGLASLLQEFKKRNKLYNFLLRLGKSKMISPVILSKATGFPTSVVFPLPTFQSLPVYYWTKEINDQYERAYSHNEVVSNLFAIHFTLLRVSYMLRLYEIEM